MDKLTEQMMLEKIMESDRLKKEACENCVKDLLKENFTKEDIQIFREIFYSNARGYLFVQESSQ